MTDFFGKGRGKRGTLAKRQTLSEACMKTGITICEIEKNVSEKDQIKGNKKGLVLKKISQWIR